jgi:hypothetical protein
MANINISDLRPAGADLFLDSESYLNDLTEGEMRNLAGGALFALGFVVGVGVSIYGARKGWW